MATAQEKKELADLLEQVHGLNYAFGWIKSIWICSDDSVLNDAVIRRTRDQLLLELIAKEKTNV
jgi:hypothetical protein